MIKALYFSPTGSSQKVALAGAGQGCEEKSWTLPKDREKIPTFEKEDVLVFAFPVYYGRVPYLLLEPLKKLKGKGAKAVVLAVYGNRAYEDALKEACDILNDRGFSIVGAAAVVAEHCYSDEVASGEPREEILEEVSRYTQERIVLNREIGDIPGDFPYRPYQKGDAPKKVPPVTGESCFFCHLCVQECPVGAIDQDCVTIEDTCILCNKCAKVCPVHAKRMVDPQVVFFKGILEKKFPLAKKVEFFQ